MRIAVLISGGVDSSVALLRLVQAGHEATAFYLKIWLEDELAHLGVCPWEEDLRFARAVCRQLGVELEVVSLQRFYHERVVADMVAQLAAGRTPSPDVWCNQRVKFGAFLDGLPPGFDRVASGHYARVGVGEDGLHRLTVAPDPVKDQTYFLCRLDQRQLARVSFPLGELAKAEVRQAATEAGLATADRPDSQGICFLGRLRFEEFVNAYLGVRPGPIVEAESARRLGTHRGHWFHTLGQRRGLGLSGGPWYVVGKDTQANELKVSRRPLADPTRCDRFQIRDLHWIAGAPAACELEVKVRHGPKRLAACLEPSASGVWRVVLERPDPGIAPGQLAVFYSGEVCLGGGPIEPWSD